MHFVSLSSCLSGRAQEQIENLRQRLLRGRAGMRGDGEGRPDLPLHRGRGAQRLLHRHLPPGGNTGWAASCGAALPPWGRV